MNPSASEELHPVTKEHPNFRRNVNSESYKETYGRIPNIIYLTLSCSLHPLSSSRVSESILRRQQGGGGEQIRELAPSSSEVLLFSLCEKLFPLWFFLFFFTLQSVSSLFFFLFHGFQHMHFSSHETHYISPTFHPS